MEKYIEIGDVVCHKCEPETKGIVNGIMYEDRFAENKQYRVAFNINTGNRWCYGCELELVESKGDNGTR